MGGIWSYRVQFGYCLIGLTLLCWYSFIITTAVGALEHAVLEFWPVH